MKYSLHTKWTLPSFYYSLFHILLFCSPSCSLTLLGIIFFLKEYIWICVSFIWTSTSGHKDLRGLRKDYQLACRIFGGLENTWSTGCIFNWLCQVFITVCFVFNFLVFHFSLILHWNQFFQEYLLVPWLCTYHCFIWQHSTQVMSLKLLFMGNQLKLKQALFDNKQRVSGRCLNKQGLFYF